MPEDDAPKSLRSATESNRRLALLEGWHVAPLTGFVERAREESGKGNAIPFFDPLDGGVAARCLFLLEAPGPRAGASGFVSRNNPDESAKNFFELNHDAGIPRELTATWNIVPRYIGSGITIRPAQKSDLEIGMWYLERVLQLLPMLEMVIVMGQKARYAERRLASMSRAVEVLRCPHPSPLYINNREGNRANILAVLQAAWQGMSRVVGKPSAEPVCWVPCQGAPDLGDFDEIVWLSVSAVESSWQKDSEYVGVGGTDRAISGRYEKVGRRFGQGGPMWLPQVCLDHSGEISFTDGRHRFAWLRDRGCTALPIQVPPDQADLIAERFGISERASFFSRL
jgi:hypothetical protein